MTSETSSGSGSNQLKFSLPDTPANPSASLASGRGRKTHDISGQTSSAPFASYDHASSSWRTLRPIAHSGSKKSSGTLPRRGSMRSGQLYELPMSAPATAATACSLLPTPVAQEDGKTPEQHAAMKRHMRGGARQTVTSLSVMAKQAELTGKWTNRLLPTPQVSGGGQASNRTSGRTNPDSQHHTGTTLADVAYDQSWGDYAPVIERHAVVVGRPAPTPTIDGKLSPSFVEWMMMFPEGWATDPVLGLSRTGQLRALGNAVVCPQAVAAWGSLLGLRFDTHTHTHRMLPTPRARDGKGPRPGHRGGPSLPEFVVDL